MPLTRAELYSRIAALIDRLAHGERDDDARNALLLELATYQIAHVPAYQRFVAQRTRGRPPANLELVPALPTDAFRFARISSRPEQEDVRCFRSSGTTHEERSVHAFQDLTLYDRAARAAARYALFPDVEALDLVVLAPNAHELPDSSLSYMLARFGAWFGRSVRQVWPVSAPALRDALCAAERPCALLGTSFAFVHALDALAGERLPLPERSRIMQTGGFKGRSREVAPQTLRASLADAFQVDERLIVAEYGMTELSSQLYEQTLRATFDGEPRERALWAPGWVRVSVVDPETLAPLPAGSEGLVRIDDLANLDSVAFIQTADLGVLSEHGLSLRGRASAAVARGCSISADELLRARRP